MIRRRNKNPPKYADSENDNETTQGKKSPSSMYKKSITKGFLCFIVLIVFLIACMSHIASKAINNTHAVSSLNTGKQRLNQRTEPEPRILGTEKVATTKHDFPAAPVRKESLILENGKVAPGHNFPAAPEFDTDGKTRLHLVFSTDCSLYQDYQSYQVFFSALKVGQAGRVTRIASGCNDEETIKTKAWYEKHIKHAMSDRFGLHFTPKFSSVMKDGKEVGNYEFFNKPHGLLHWLEHGDGMGVDATSGKLLDEDVIVILIDPDMMFFRPIGADFTKKEEYIFYPNDNNDEKYRVEHGSPIAQMYGFGSEWARYKYVAGDDSPAKLVTDEIARNNYPVGPPYLATGRDMYSIARKWSEFVPKVHQEYPHLLAEMFAFCIAAAHLELPHQQIQSLMISTTGGKEGWPFIDNIPAEEACDVSLNANDADGYKNTKYSLPNVLHFCQRYFVGEWFFGKRKVSKETDFFTCEAPLLAIPPSDLGSKYDYGIPPGKKHTDDPKVSISSRVAKREAFAICALITRMNEAAEFFKDMHCGDNKNTRRDKSLNLWDTF